MIISDATDLLGHILIFEFFKELMKLSIWSLYSWCEVLQNPFLIKKAFGVMQVDCQMKYLI